MKEKKNPGRDTAKGGPFFFPGIFFPYLLHLCFILYIFPPLLQGRDTAISASGGGGGGVQDDGGRGGDGGGKGVSSSLAVGNIFFLFLLFSFFLITCSFLFLCGDGGRGEGGGGKGLSSSLSVGILLHEALSC